MSTKSSLLIFFFCLSLHACNGRRIKEGPSSKSHFSIKVLGSSLQPMKMDSSVSRGTKEDDIVNTEESSSSLKEPALHARNISGLVPIKLPISVPQNVPAGKKNRHPGFFSDYSRPRTRPPSHN